MRIYDRSGINEFENRWIPLSGPEDKGSEDRRDPKCGSAECLSPDRPDREMRVFRYAEVPKCGPAEMPNANLAFWNGPGGNRSEVR